MDPKLEAKLAELRKLAEANPNDHVYGVTLGLFEMSLLLSSQVSLLQGRLRALEERVRKVEATATPF